MPEPAPAAISLANRNLLATSVLVDELVRNGLRDVCISPGSRSAPLTLAFARRPDVRRHVHVDERCAAFFALGLARASGRPVALVCTSGSAAANYHPAVMEAFETGVPLIVLGADRPQRLVDSGANQTTVQAGLFGPHVLRSESWDLPSPDPTWLRWLRGRVCRLVQEATGRRAGPIHVNLPFEEPLSAVELAGDVPANLMDVDPVALRGRPDGAPWSRRLDGIPTLSAAALSGLRGALEGEGLVVIGPLDATPELAESILAMSASLGAPILADPLSGLRGRPGVVATADAILRAGAPEALRPDWVLWFGRTPVSKALFRFLGALPGDRVFHVDHSDRRDDPEHAGPTALPVDAGWLASQLTEAPRRSEGALYRAWAAAAAAADRSLSSAIDGAGFFEGRLVRAMLDVVPDDALVWLASSMPVREVDAFAAGFGGTRLMASRGVSGIDGLISTTYGADAGHDGPTVGLIGDLATLHDVGGLAAARRLNARATLVVINNGGGGIFEHLPLAGTDAPMKELFVAEHEQTFGGIAEAFGLRYAVAGDEESFRQQLSASLADPAPWLIEVPVDRAASLAWHRGAWAAVADSLG